MKKHSPLKPIPIPKANERPPQAFEAEVAEGLEEVAADEIRRRLGGHLYGKIELQPSAVRFEYVGRMERLKALRTVQTLYHVELFDVPRPRGLLGNQQIGIVVRNIQSVIADTPTAAFKTFDIHAAGSDSSIMRRIRDEIQARTGLIYAQDGGDLLLRIRPGKGERAGWEVLTRTTPRPLATREWRVCNLEGALNATIAHAMNLMTRPALDQVYVNLGCGSGTLLIERLAYGQVQQIIGIDDDPSVLDCARQNIAASRYSGIELRLDDATDSQLDAASVDVITADLPFGQAIGSHMANQALYPALLAEAGRIARPGAIFAAITHEVKLMERCLEQQSAWAIQRVIRTTLRGLHPRIYILERVSA